MRNIIIILITSILGLGITSCKTRPFIRVKIEPPVQSNPRIDLSGHSPSLRSRTDLPLQPNPRIGLSNTFPSLLPVDNIVSQKEASETALQDIELRGTQESQNEATETTTIVIDQKTQELRTSVIETAATVAGTGATISVFNGAYPTDQKENNQDNANKNE